MFFNKLFKVFLLLSLLILSYQITKSNIYYVYPDDSPAQDAYQFNTLDELNWTSFTITQTGVITGITINFTWNTDLWPDEGSLLLQSPSGTSVVVATNISGGNYSIDLTDFNNETLNGTWYLWIEDSFGDGGHQATNISIEFNYTAGTNMTYQSSNCYQITDPTGKGMTNQVILRIEVVMSGTNNPLSATSFSFNTTGTTNTADISNAKLYYTGTSSTFNTNNQFGSTVNNPSGNFTINGTQQLSNGTNYFWLTYDIAQNATIGNVVDASCNSITIGGTARTPTTTSPSGNRPITYLKVYCESFEGSSFPPQDWQNIKVAGTDSRLLDRVTSGTSPTCSPHSGSYMIRYNSFSIPSGNSAALITPIIDWSQRSTYTPKVRFWMYRDPGYSSNTQEGVTVYVNTSPSVSGATQLGFVSRYYATAGWYYFEYNIPSSFNGSTNYIIFLAYSQYGNNIFVDDICYDAYPATMQYVSSTTTQIPGSVGVGFSNQPIIRLEITTQGATDPLTLSSITFNINGTTNVSDITAAKVYYTGTSTNFSTSTQFGSTVRNPSGTFSVTGSQTLSPGTNYFWLVYDISSSATIGNFVDAQCTSFVLEGNNYTPSVTNPAGAREIRGPRCGTYTVGTGQYYQNLTEAFDEINTLGMGCNVTLEIATDIVEPGPNPPTLNQWTEHGGSGYTLTIKPVGGPRRISGTFANNGLIVLNGADRVTFDGRIGGQGRYLTFRNDATSASTAAIIWLKSLGTNAGCQNVVIRNCNIVGIGNSYSPSQTSSMGIYIAGTTISTAGSGADNDYVTIQNNSINRCYYGIFAGGVSGGNLDSLKILNNIIGSDVQTDYIGYRGIYIYQYAQGVIIEGNTVYNIKRTDGLNLAAVELNTYCSDAKIVGNKIYGIYQESAGGWGAYGININSSMGNSNILIANNMISDIHTMNYNATSTTYNPFGIRITGGTNYKIYHNTVNLHGSQANVGTSPSMSACLLITNTAVTGTDLRNNIFANSLGSSISGSKMYSIYVPSGFTFSTINYNDYYVSGNYGILGFFGADKTTLADWSSSSGGDGNSINVQPIFISNNDLHLTGSMVGDNRFFAPAITGITYDFDNEIRRDTDVNIGCDEIRPLLDASPISFNPLNSVYCKDGSVTLTANARVIGFGDGIVRSFSTPNFAYQWFKNQNEITNATNQNLIFNSLVQDDSADYSCIISFMGESVTTQSALLKVESPIEIISHPQNASICIDLNPSINLTSTSDGTIIGWQWQKRNPNNPNVWEDIPDANGPNLIQSITNPQEATGFYRVVVMGPGNCGPSKVYSNPAFVDVTETVKTNFVQCDKDPANICENDDFTLSSTATGTITGYKWQKLIGGSWVDLDLDNFPTARQRTLQFHLANPSMSGTYRVLVYGSEACYPDGNPVPSQEINITVWPLFRIVKQPQPQSACVGNDVMTFVITEGIVLNYQWQKDNQDITDNPTATSPVFVINNAKYENSGVYRCKLTIQDCRGIIDIYTNDVLIYIHPKTKISRTNKTQVVKLGDVATFDFDAVVEGIQPTGEIQIQWYRGNQPLIDNDRISGSKSNYLTIRDVRASDLGSNYWVTVTGLCGSDTAQGFTILTPTIDITSQPNDVSACEGQTVEFSVQANFTGGTSLDYQWRKDGIALVDNGRITGSQSPTLTITNINIGDVGNYDVVLTNNPSGYSTTSAPAQLNVEVQPTIIQQPPSSINLNSGEKLKIEIIADGTEPLTYQWYKDGVQIVDANQSTYEKSSVTNEDAGTYYCKVQNDCGEVISNNCIVSVTLKQVAGLQSSINDLILEQNNPNPVNSHTIISFSVPNEGNASVEIFDVVGRKVATL
ncbi:MAG: BNR-repeat neuraminidase N-terminal domain-containing protein, partial [Candidatus Kapaibacteriota bacterium]